MKKRKILVFGYFGFRTNQLDGQTVKTREIYNLIKQSPDYAVDYADSLDFRYEFSEIWKFLFKLMECNTLVILPGLNNLRYIFPLTFILSYIFNYRIVHVGIGGWHSKFLKQRPIVRYMLRHIEINLLEAEKGIKELKKYFGMANTALIPNFRTDRTDIREIKEKRNSNTLNLVFLARINIKKGLDTIADLLSIIDRNGLANRISITFYGPFDSNEDKEFLYTEIINEYRNSSYGGKLEPRDIVGVLANKDVFLFPTHYYTEGFPGSVLDSYRAGVPVIATNWEHATQFVKDGVSGFIVDFDDPVDEIFSHIRELVFNADLLSELKKGAIAESLKYTPEEAWKILKNYL